MMLDNGGIQDEWNQECSISHHFKVCVHVYDLSHRATAAPSSSDPTELSTLILTIVILQIKTSYGYGFIARSGALRL